MSTFKIKDYAKILKDWVVFSQKHLYVCPERTDLTCYGAGEHGHWGVHTHQKAFSAFAVAAVSDEIDFCDSPVSKEQVLNQAISMLRYTLATHITGDFVCNDGGTWGHNWIYALGIERMFHGIEAIWDYLTDEDKKNLRKVLISESDFLLEKLNVDAGLVEFNVPESNIWNGSIMYRTAILYPDCENRDRYIEKAKRFFVNGISIETDENSDEIVDGIRIGDLYKGSNMFNSYACNHHGYLNIGYMVICLSGIAMLHFFLKSKNIKGDDIIYHHAYDLWKLVNTCTFKDGRILRIGGDTRARYCYCQDYVLPMWALIEDVYNEDCTQMEDGWLNILKTETSVNGDGSFLSNRFGAFENRSPVYYTRLETDRANTVSMALYWHSKYALKGSRKTPDLKVWEDKYHGAQLVASGNRYASFVWRAAELPQGLIVSKEDSSMAEWRYNLSGRIMGVGRKNYDELEGFKTSSFEGGFITYGSTISVSDDYMAEGQLKEKLARKYVAFTALPDEHTILCIQNAKTLNRSFIDKIQGILWNIPNDIFNNRQRIIYHNEGILYLRGGDYANQYGIIELGNYVNIDDSIGIASSKPLKLIRNGKRQVEIKGRENSGTLYAEEICSDYADFPRWYDRGSELINTAFAVSLGSKYETKRLYDNMSNFEINGIKAIMVKGYDGEFYLLSANFNTAESQIGINELNFKKLIDIQMGYETDIIKINSGEAKLFKIIK